MKLRVKMSIIFCIVFALLSSFVFILLGYLGTGHGGIPTQTFVPVKIKTVQEDEDILLCVQPTEGTHSDKTYMVPLNSIKKGWIIAQYQGYCRLVFDIKDTDIENVDAYIEGMLPNNHYFYVQPVSRDRLKITDYSASLSDETEDPFASERIPLLMHYQIDGEIDNYYRSRLLIPTCVGLNVVFILLTVGINLIANAVEKRKQR